MVFSPTIASKRPLPVAVILWASSSLLSLSVDAPLAAVYGSFFSSMKAILHELKRESQLLAEAVGPASTEHIAVLSLPRIQAPSWKQIALSSE